MASWAAFDVAIAVAAMGAASTLWLSIFSAVVFGVIALVRRENITREHLRFIFPRGCARVLGLCFTLASFKLFPVGIVVTIGASSALISLSIFARLRNEHVHISTYLFSLLGIVGIFLVSRQHVGGELFAFDIRLIIPMLGAAVSAYSAFLWRESAHVMHPVSNLAILHTWSALLSLPVILILSTITPTQIAPSHNLIAVTCIIVFAGIGDVLFLRSQLHTTITINAILGPCTPVFASLFAIVVLHQHLWWWQWTGLVIVVASVSLSTMLSQRKGTLASIEPYFSADRIIVNEPDFEIA